MTPGGGRSRPRVIGVIVIVVVLGLGLFGLASLSLDDGKDDPVQITGASEVQRLVGGIPQLGDRLGQDDAPVTIEVFSDVVCDACATYQLDVIDQLIEDEVRAGDVKLVFHHYSMDPERATSVGGFGAVAAGLQDHQWQFIELFFRNQDEIENNTISQPFLDQIANGIINFNVEQWQRDFNDQEVQDILAEDEEMALDRRLPLDPTVVVSGPSGSKELLESPSIDEIRAAVDEVSAE